MTFHQVYPGNIPDSVQLSTITADLVRRYDALREHCRDVTLIYDKGNNSLDNQVHIDESPYHFVGSLVPSHHRDILAVSLVEYADLKPPFAGEKAYRNTRRAMGVDRTVVATYSENLFAGQIQGLSQHLSRAVRGLRQLQRELARPRKGRNLTLAAIHKRVLQILSAQHLKALVSGSRARRSAPGGQLPYGPGRSSRPHRHSLRQEHSLCRPARLEQ